ncbi:ribosomal protein L21 [Desulfarculus baarsii DSM 2075]|uniref:Large ribosomal subunit protein bL21 n=1 Tax=Desulfarculus baarsii (strain ATCC 33931 / DSM 2075 / LMG 7858 / VKM B-1802 / 2st14) TaxID=644282 RepID=E1QJL8_DESB2|nr:50S ribosomal protein L21 [Desulfarculus baarsii]ADK85761.1 ribosomal protein L21 [Desulfarculus baarsii DSM 2075]
MYAVVANGGKQYKLEPGEVLRLEKMAGEVGDNISLSPVLMVGGDGEPKIGQPHVAGAVVEATIIEQGKARKVLIFKKKRRKGYRVKRGHRQHFTAVRVTGISA